MNLPAQAQGYCRARETVNEPYVPNPIFLSAGFLDVVSGDGIRRYEPPSGRIEIGNSLRRKCSVYRDQRSSAFCLAIRPVEIGGADGDTRSMLLNEEEAMDRI